MRFRRCKIDLNGNKYEGSEIAMIAVALIICATLCITIALVGSNLQALFALPVTGYVFRWLIGRRRSEEISLTDDNR